MAREQDHVAHSMPSRNLPKLLDETFVIYGRHFWRFASLAAFVQIPVSLVTLAVFLMDDDSGAAFFALFMLGSLGTIFVYGAVVYAVGQQYVSGGISVRACYARAWWRVVSLAVYALILSGITYGILLSLAHVTQLVVVASVALVAIVVIVHMSMAVQAAIVQGYKTAGALKRSYSLVRGKWWRIFGILLVIGLVATGLGIVASIPFAIPLMVLGADPGSQAANYIQALGGLAVRTFVLPVIFIAGTLLYYDLRVREEEYDLTKLTQEMGLAAV